jgi:hypothetical protein
MGEITWSQRVLERYKRPQDLLNFLFYTFDGKVLSSITPHLPPELADAARSAAHELGLGDVTRELLPKASFGSPSPPSSISDAEARKLAEESADARRAAAPKGPEIYTSFESNRRRH